MRIALMVAAFLAPAAVYGQSEELQKIREELDASKKRIEELERRDREREEHAAHHHDQAALSLGAGVTALLVDLSLDILAVGGLSTARDEELDLLLPGHHDPAGRGFTLQNAELTIEGAVKPYFKAEAHMTWVVSDEGESEVELEEAFFETTCLPAGFRIRGGYSFLEFGRQNRQHPHEREFVDQPVCFSRFFGADGLRSTGFHVSWRAPLAVHLEAVAGIYNAFGETMFSFNQDDDPVIEGGLDRRSVRSVRDMAFLGRLAGRFDMGDAVSSAFGMSFVHGPNATGTRADTDLFGVDAHVRWEKAHEGPFIEVQAEVLLRRFERAAFDDGAGTEFAHEWFQDWGWYAQVVVGFHPDWTAGLRFDWADGEIDDENPLHDHRVRISPAVTWSPTEFSRIRLQYNYDHASHITSGRGHDEHSIWLQVEIYLGRHADHAH